MTSAGLARVEQAKADGSWSRLEAVEALVIPPDLAAALQAQAPAAANFEAFPRSSKRLILEARRDPRRPGRRFLRKVQPRRIWPTAFFVGSPRILTLNAERPSRLISTGRSEPPSRRFRHRPNERGDLWQEAKIQRSDGSGTRPRPGFASRWMRQLTPAPCVADTLSRCLRGLARARTVASTSIDARRGLTWRLQKRLHPASS